MHFAWSLSQVFELFISIIINLKMVKGTHFAQKPWWRRSTTSLFQSHAMEAHGIHHLLDVQEPKLQSQ